MSITSANSILLIGITNLYPVPQQLQGFGVDDAYSMPDVTNAEVVMGVDGTLSGGMVLKEVVQKIHLSPDSPSIPLFDAWYTAQQQTRKAFAATAIIKLPGIGKSYVCTTGWLTNYTPIPAAKKLLGPQEFEITWQSVNVVPIA